MKAITYAPEAFRLLNGFFCIYKPAGLHSAEVRATLAANLARDLNALESRPPKDLVTIEGTVASGKPFSVKVLPNMADHVLVVGPRYQIQDFRIAAMCSLSKAMSGVQVLAVNNGCAVLHHIRNNMYLQTLEVKGQFGYATNTFMHDGKVLEKSSYAHIRPYLLDKQISSIQATHQSEAFKYAGVPLESQEAYELASQGIIRPRDKKSPTLMYNIKCTEFDLPHFTLKIQCFNASKDFLANLIHQLGIYLRSCAVCCHIRQTHFAHFTADYSLLKKHWTLEHILTNIALCQSIMNSEKMMNPSIKFQPVEKQELMHPVEEMRNVRRMEEINHSLMQDV